MKKKGEAPPGDAPVRLPKLPKQSILVTPTADEGAQPDPDLSIVLALLAERRAELDALDDDITGLIRRVETAMRRHFSVRISITFSHDDVTGEIEALVFGKWDGKWQLLIMEGEPDDPETWKYTPLVSAGREVRAEVFRGLLDDMIRGAVEQLDGQIRERREALASGVQLARALEPAHDYGDPPEVES